MSAVRRLDDISRGEEESGEVECKDCGEPVVFGATVCLFDELVVIQQNQCEDDNDEDEKVEEETNPNSNSILVTCLPPIQLAVRSGRCIDRRLGLLGEPSVQTPSGIISQSRDVVCSTLSYQSKPRQGTIGIRGWTTEYPY